MEGGEAAGIMNFHRARGGRAAGSQPRRPARSGRREPARECRTLAKRRCRKCRSSGSPGQLAAPAPAGRKAPTVMPSVPGVEVRIGARTLSREITVGGGHAGGTSGWIHFGTGTAERARVRVQWPDGEWGPWIRLYTNQFARITRGQPSRRDLVCRPFPGEVRGDVHETFGE